MSSSEEKPLPLPLTNEDTTTAQSDSSKPKKLTTVIGVLLIVGVVATVGVCVAVFAPAKHNNEMKGEDTQGGDLQVKEQLYGKVNLVHVLIYSCSWSYNFAICMYGFSTACMAKHRYTVTHAVVQTVSGKQ